MLTTLAQLSHEFGTPAYVKGGGGNTSAKDATTLWVKPSGTNLPDMTPQSFIGMDRRRISQLFAVAMPENATAREAAVKDLVATAVLPGYSGRPSVEAPLHHLLHGTFVVHTHPAPVNGLTCSRQGSAACARLFPEALWIPYVDPGYTVCMSVRTMVRKYEQDKGHPPNLLLLENHGIFVSGDSVEALRATYDHVLGILAAEYARAGVPTTLATRTCAGDGTARVLQELLGAEATHVACAAWTPIMRKPVTPDHIVYAKSFPYEGPLTKEGIAEFRTRNGYTPLVYLADGAVYAIGTSRKKAELVLEVAMDGALVVQLSEAFGGAQSLDERSREFIEHWEAESYRQAQVQ